MANPFFLGSLEFSGIRVWKEQNKANFFLFHVISIDFEEGNWRTWITPNDVLRHVFVLIKKKKKVKICRLNFKQIFFSSKIQNASWVEREKKQTKCFVYWSSRNLNNLSKQILTKKKAESCFILPVYLWVLFWGSGKIEVEDRIWRLK